MSAETLIMSIVTLCVSLMILLVVIPALSTSIASALPPTSAWNQSPVLTPIPVPLAQPQGGSNIKPGGPPDWLWFGVIFFTVGSISAALFKFIFFRRPSTRQTNHGIDYTLAQSGLAPTAVLEIPSPGPEETTKTELRETPNDQKGHKSRWESLE